MGIADGVRVFFDLLPLDTKELDLRLLLAASEGVEGYIWKHTKCAANKRAANLTTGWRLRACSTG